MGNHVTPSELADQLQMRQEEVIGRAVAMDVPILNGEIDRFLFEASLRHQAEERGEQPEVRAA